MSGTSMTVEPESQVQDLLLPLLWLTAGCFSPSKDIWPGETCVLLFCVVLLTERTTAWAWPHVCAVHMSSLIILRVA